MSIELCKLSDYYTVKAIQPDDIPAVYQLCKGNPTYYTYMKSDLTLESVAQDLKALPPNKSYDDRFYVGFYEENKLIAILNLVIEYPDKETSYIGFFIMNKEYQGRGIGTDIINGVLVLLKEEGFTYARLGCIKENREGNNFWKRNMFLSTGSEKETDDYTIVVMQRKL